MEQKVKADIYSKRVIIDLAELNQGKKVSVSPGSTVEDISPPPRSDIGP